jgi:hypothetical protein
VSDTQPTVFFDDDGMIWWYDKSKTLHVVNTSMNWQQTKRFLEILGNWQAKYHLTNEYVQHVQETAIELANRCGYDSPLTALLSLEEQIGERR